METCEDCGGEVEYVDNEWARFMDSYDEEIVDIYKCKKCEAKFSVRKTKEVRKFDA